MGLNEYIRFALALGFVLALMGIAAQLARRTSWGRMAMPGRNRRITVLEIRPLDARHKLVLVKCDDREHLLALGPQGQTVLESAPAKPEPL